MATRTPLQLTKAVMEKLAVIDPLQAPSAEDHAMVQDRYTELMESLAFENLAYWPANEIPLLVFPALTDLVALHAASGFGKPVNLAEIENLEVPIKRRIRRYTRMASSKDEIYQDDF